MTREGMKKLVELAHHLWNTGELAAIPDAYTPDFIGHFPTRSGLGDLKGHTGVRDTIERVRRAFPNWTETVEDIIVEDDKVVSRYISTGVHMGPFLDLAPTGKRVRLNEISILRVHDGRVAEQWCVTDQTE